MEANSVRDAEVKYVFGRKGHGYEDKIVRDLNKTKTPFLYEPYPLVYYLRTRNAKCNECGSSDVSAQHDYIPDFVSMDGSIVVEAKGKFTPPMRTKMLAVKANHPNVIIRMLFQRNNWLTTKHKARYSDWCVRNNIEWAVGNQLPRKWKTEFKQAKQRGIQKG